MSAQEDPPEESRPLPVGRGAGQPGDVDPTAEPSLIRPPNETPVQQARDTGDAYAGPGGFANSGIVQLVLDANDAERFSTTLVWKLLEAIDSLESQLRGLDDGPVPSTRGLRSVQLERNHLRKRRRRAESQLRRARADKKRANRLRHAAEQWAEKWALEHARTGRVPRATVQRQRLIEPTLPSRAFGGDHDEVLRAIALELDANARELGRLRRLLRAGQRKPRTALLIALLITTVVAIALVVSMPFSAEPGRRGIRAPATGPADGLTTTMSRSASTTPPQAPPRRPSRAPDNKASTDSPASEALDSPRPSSSPAASSRKSIPRRPVPRETPSTSAQTNRPSSKIFIVRGHRNEMNVNMTGFEPDEDVMIYAYTDTDTTDGPYDQRIHTIDADGTREFGAFPMEAPGRYWVVASGVKSNVIAWAG
ncbi:hypothetical protein [Streptomyces sp. NBC_00690]|uniref:hypothetical protein n=1 Tax=Streptomyces sp. NBC_00690 TaxID=2975808 RepID=UPI002E2946F8|nr:hypothetical protein [Streptomyces sp. NBC_00690]